jgi:hypothetical protein
MNDYVTPEMKIIVFEMEDVITTSNESVSEDPVTPEIPFF